MTAPGPSQSLYTGLSSRSHSLASRSRSVHSLLNMEIPPPPKALRSNTNTKDTKHKRTDPPALEISHRDSGQSLHRSQSQDRLEDWAPVLGDSASLRARPLRPPYSDMRSVSVEHQPPEERSGLYRTISRATLVDQDTGNVYQVIRHSCSCEQSEIWETDYSSWLRISAVTRLARPSWCPSPAQTCVGPHCPRSRAWPARGRGPWWAPRGWGTWWGPRPALTWACWARPGVSCSPSGGPRRGALRRVPRRRKRRGGTRTWRGSSQFLSPPRSSISSPPPDKHISPRSFPHLYHHCRSDIKCHQV